MTNPTVVVGQWVRPLAGAAVGALGLLAALALGGCAGQEESESGGGTVAGSLRTGADETDWCLEIAVGSDVTFSATVLQNTGEDDLVLTGVELVDPAGLELLDGVVVPGSDRGGIGNLPGWPPADSVLAADGLLDSWEQRMSADDALLRRAGDSPEHVLVLGLRRTADDGPASFGSLVMRYSQDGEEYRTSVPTSLRLADTC
ncbi:hypothetical protein [Aquipuribacter nitratireducens]|uniref:Lipoprotein n=1 Tax=Aquipuribacter nitratireducens TaxID=650104 RepID=A0ABW0GPW8_9MICO